MADRPAGYVVTVTDKTTGVERLCGYGRGPGWHAAKNDFEFNLRGADKAMRNSMRSAAIFTPVDDDKASEVEEMLAAEPVRWS